MEQSNEYPLHKASHWRANCFWSAIIDKPHRRNKPTVIFQSMQSQDLSDYHIHDITMLRRAEMQWSQSAKYGTLKNTLSTLMHIIGYCTLKQRVLTSYSRTTMWYSFELLIMFYGRHKLALIPGTKRHSMQWSLSYKFGIQSNKQSCADTTGHNYYNYKQL